MTAKTKDFVDTIQAENMVKTSAGLVRAVCRFCGKKSAAGKPGSDGQPDLFRMGAGWWEAPFSADYVHKSDGSVGSLYTCPACDKRSRSGEPLQMRAYIAQAHARFWGRPT